MFATGTENAFANLPAAGNEILRGHPNHLLINGDIFLMASGAPNVRAKTLAKKIIDFLRVIGHDEGSDEDDESDDEEMIAIKKEASTGVETLMAMLWASENAGLAPIQLQDVPDNGTLNQIIRNVKSKLTTGRLGGIGPVIAEEPGARGATEAAAWAVSSQSIVQELNRMHESREADRAQKESNTSLRLLTRLKNNCSRIYANPILSPTP